VWFPNLYVYAGNNPIVFNDPRGRNRKKAQSNEETAKLLQNQLSTILSEAITSGLVAELGAKESTKIIADQIEDVVPYVSLGLDFYHGIKSLLSDPSLENLSFVTLDITVSAVSGLISIAVPHLGHALQLSYNLNRVRVHNWLNNSWWANTAGGIMYEGYRSAQYFLNR
jgi:hypothetical protein